jgi:23S rRNA pseudouridine2605 synthase
MPTERLQKILASAGIASRRKCEELILEGLVQVNGKVVDTLPAFADPDKDTIIAIGRRIRPQPKVYFLLNKPKGVICTNFDPQARPRAIDLVLTRHRIFCVGRLDIDTTGLLILTNDSELANRLTHPRYGLTKTYIAEVKGKIEGTQADRLKQGVWLAEGRSSRTAIKILKRGPDRSLVEITITEGLNREVQRMFLKVGLPVKSLKRTRIGKITDRGLGIGHFRLLTHSEVAYLKKATGSTPLISPAKAKPRPPFR